MKTINNKGQVLVVFVIILPLMLLGFGIFIEKGYIYYEKTKIENIIKVACNSENPIEIIEKNDDKIESKMIIENDIIIIEANKKVLNNMIKIKKVCEEW